VTDTKSDKGAREREIKRPKSRATVRAAFFVVEKNFQMFPISSTDRVMLLPFSRVLMVLFLLLTPWSTEDRVGSQSLDLVLLPCCGLRYCLPPFSLSVMDNFFVLAANTMS
jgi:hypothetical protein